MIQDWGRHEEELHSKKQSRRASDYVKEPKILEIVDNKIYFYSEIERDTVLVLNSKLRGMDHSHVADVLNLGLDTPIPIYLYINSYGGGIFHGLSAMDNILNSKSPVITVVDGICASAGTFLSLVGKKRLITEHSMMLIHQLFSSFWGKYTEFEDKKENLDLLMRTIKKIYKQYTKIPAKKLDELLKHDLYFDAETCLELGLVDEIVTKEEINERSSNRKIRKRT